MNPPDNPYIAGRALGDSDPCFVGRVDVLRLVEFELRSRDRNCVVLYGQRRIGKTTILKQLEQRLTQGMLAIRFDLFGYTSKSLGRMLAGLAESISNRLEMPQPDPMAFDNEGLYFRRYFLPAVYETLGEKRRLVLLFDEFDVLDVDVAQKLDASTGEVAFFNYLREIMENEPRLGFVVVIGRKAEDLTQGARSAFRLGSRYKRVSVLDSESARTLVHLAEKQGHLRLKPGVADYILELTACHPYLTQLVCQRIFDRIYERPLYSTTEGGGAPPPAGPPAVDLQDVDSAVSDALEAGNNILEWIWNGLPPAERVVSAAIAAAAEQHRVVTRDEINRILQDHGIRRMVRELNVAPETLVEWELLRETAGGYRFFVEMFRRWIFLNHPMRRVKEELDGTVLQAKLHYELGKGYAERGQWSEAERELRRALSENPNHIRAHILLGESLHRQGRLAEAEEQLYKEALPRDREQARFPTVQVLTDRIAQLRTDGELEQALEKYLALLELSPSDKHASEELRLLRVELGRKNLAAGKFEEATRYFQEAGDNEGKLSALRGYAHSLESVEDYDAALKVLAAIANIPQSDDEQRNTTAAQTRCLRARDLEQNYNDGRTHIEKGKPVEALASWIEVILNRPNYKDVASLILAAAYALVSTTGQELPAPLRRQRRILTSLSLVIGFLLGGAVTTASGLLFSKTLGGRDKSPATVAAQAPQPEAAPSAAAITAAPPNEVIAAAAKEPPAPAAPDLGGTAPAVGEAVAAGTPGPSAPPRQREGVAAAAPPKKATAPPARAPSKPPRQPVTAQSETKGQASERPPIL